MTRTRTISDLHCQHVKEIPLQCSFVLIIGPPFPYHNAIILRDLWRHLIYVVMFALLHKKS